MNSKKTWNLKLKSFDLLSICSKKNQRVIWILKGLLPLKPQRAINPDKKERERERERERGKGGPDKKEIRGSLIFWGKFFGRPEKKLKKLKKKKLGLGQPRIKMFFWAALKLHLGSPQGEVDLVTWPNSNVELPTWECRPGNMDWTIWQCPLHNLAKLDEWL